MLIRLILSLLSTVLILIATAYFVPGFIIDTTPQSLIITATISTIISRTLGRILRLFFGPFIVLTLGLFHLVINGIVLYFLDIFTQGVTINGLVSLIYATILISVLNFFIQFLIKRLIK
jgi:putative membrane protein